MFKKNYYCLVAGFPDILIDDTKLIETTAKFKKELSEQLDPKDYKLAELLYLQTDNKNLLNLLQENKKPFKPNGKYSLEELEEQIKEPTYILDYLKQFIISFKTETPVYPELSWENQLQSQYYNYAYNCENDFLKEWFLYDLNFKNIVTAINCRQFNFETEKQLIPVQFENEVYDSLIKTSPKKELLLDYIPNVIKILHFAESKLSLTEREKGLDTTKWNYLDETTFFHYFTIEKLLSFVIKLEILERWFALDEETGKELFEKLIGELKTSYQFSEEFKVQGRK